MTLLLFAHGANGKMSASNVIHNGQHPPMRQWFVLLSSEDGQDIAVYAVMVAVILIIVVWTLRLIGSNGFGPKS